MGISLVNITHNETTNTGFGSLNNVTKPTGVVQDDLIILAFACDGSANGNVLDQPGDWTSAFTALHPTGDGQYLHVYYKFAGGSEPSAYSFQSNASGGNDVGYICAAFRGVDKTTPLDVSIVTTTNSSGNTSVVSVSLTGATVATENAVVVWVAAGDPNSASSGTWGVPSGYSSADTRFANFAPLAIGYKTVSAGATGSIAGSLTFTGGTAGFAGAVIVLRPDSSSSPTITPNSGSLTLTGAAPQVIRTAVTPGTASLSITGAAAQVTQQLFRTPAAGSLVLTGGTPTLQTLGTIRPNPADLVLNGLAPSVIQAHSRQPGSASITITGLAPTVNGSRTMQPASGSLTITGNLAQQIYTLNPPATGSLTLTGQTPLRLSGFGRQPAAGALVLTGQTPVVRMSFVVTPVAGSLVITGYAPGNSGVTIRPGTATVAITGQTPFVQGALTIQPGSGALAITGIAPALTGANIIRPNPGALTFSGIAPALATGIGRVPSSGSLTLTGIAPTVRVPIFITPASGELVISGQLSPSAGTGGGDGTDGGSGLVQRHAARQGIRRPIRSPLRATNA